jgi:hypothetical protein
MRSFHARVKGGHLVIDEPTDLPEGTELRLAILDTDEDMSEAEQAELEALLQEGRADIARAGGGSAEGETWPSLGVGNRAPGEER